MFNTGLVVKTKGLIDALRFGEINYVPKKYSMPSKIIQSKSQAWVGLEKIIVDIIEFSGIETNTALEFGVEFGYSTSALANYFKSVIGVDTFTGDDHAGHYGDIFPIARNNLVMFENIELVRSNYQDYQLRNNNYFDFIHVDIIHTYHDTYACGLWSAEHSDCTIFHDTQSYPDVKRAVADIARKTKKKFYNYRKCNGLGIVI